MGGETLFFDYKCNFDRPESEEIVLCSDWCPREFKKPLLVVGSSDGTLNLFHDEGERLENAIKRQHPPTCCAWGPAPHYLLATGWDDGAVSLWNVATDEKSKLIKEDKAVHSKSICLVTWSPNGDRLVSSDLDGVVGVWKPDDKGR
jgi:WD40 repeat protein